MKIAVRLLFVVVVLAFTVSLSQAEPRQIAQGTQVHLKLLSDISTSSSRNGESFIAVTTEPLMMGSELMWLARAFEASLPASAARAALQYFAAKLT
jgi:hypothetical protein